MDINFTLQKPKQRFHKLKAGFCKVELKTSCLLLNFEIKINQFNYEKNLLNLSTITINTIN